METEKTLSPSESLNLITEAIAKTKENIRENSFGFLLWGWLIALASFAFFLLQNFTTFHYYFIPFPLLVAFGIITTILFSRKKRASSTISYTTYFMGKMWAALGIGFILVVFINVSHGQIPFTYTLIMAGIGTLMSGWVMKFQPLVLGGLLFLLAALVNNYMAAEYQALLHGVAIILGYLIPGYLLKNSKA